MESNDDFRNVLDQRQLIAKIGADKLAAFAQADPAHPLFLAWLLRNTPALDLYLEGAVPIGLAAREKNDYTLAPAGLEIWERILQADPGVQAAATGKPAPAVATAAPALSSKGPIQAVAGVFRVEAAAFAQTGGQISWAGQISRVLVHDSVNGGQQVYFQQQMKSQWADYLLEVPAAGTYQIVMKAAGINADQALELCAGREGLATVPIALSYGLWQDTAPVELKLAKGIQTLRVQTSTRQHLRGIALRSFELKGKS